MKRWADRHQDATRVRGRPPEGHETARAGDLDGLAALDLPAREYLPQSTPGVECRHT